ncbi:NAD-dependent DNA ligase LigA [Blattabacterium cuenoti]|uniref:NAD-dependent DNA ligase LigA n=1 Tax=Blattabacterium cuenoti TaxID=1653831 RepID=UPI00163D2461|nr:NAD-dependent DNA ligase LigA [Blattabacterium cuenoti]
MKQDRNKKEIKEKIFQLRKKLSEYNYQYYTLDTSEISDYNFDKKLRELFLLEKEHPEFYDPSSPTLRIGVEGEKKYTNSSIYSHKYKMYSLQNTYSKKELITWKKRIHQSISSSLSFVCELKYDGVSINLIYKNGFLTHAVTRGNGKKGEEVIENVRTIQSIPLKLIGEKHPSYLEIRGEIFLPIKKFLEINAKRTISGKKPYANPRNTASGTLKIKNSKEVYKRTLSCIVYSVMGKNLPFDTQYQALKTLRNWGFEISENFLLCSKKTKDIFHFLDYWTQWKKTLPYQIDGIVIKVNEYQNQFLLGYTNKYPRWAIAYKFRPKKLSETRLLNLKFQVGRTGIITPVAEVMPKKISGTIVKRVTLYNDHFIQKMGIHYGDALLLEKGGDIIPKVAKINLKKRLINASPIYFLKKCPSCKSHLRKKNELFYCPNNFCPSQNMKKIQHFVSERAMNIKGIGKEMIKKLYQKGFLYNISDLYQLKKEKLLQIDGVKEKLADFLIKNIEKSKDNLYQRVLYALGIPHVGEDISKKLTEKFSNVNSLMQAEEPQLTSISGIGKKISESIKTFFSIKENKKIVEILMKHGLNFSDFYKKNPVKNQYSPIEGKSFLFTGRLSSMTRNKAKKLVELLGGRVFHTVNKKIHFLVVGKNFGSKLEKCMKKNHIKILTEDIFMKFLEQEKKEK